MDKAVDDMETIIEHTEKAYELLDAVCKE